MFSESSPLRRIDLRALPISVKITLGLTIALLIGGFAADLVMNQIVRDAQADLALNDLATFSRSQAFRTVDTIGQETTFLSQLGAGTFVQERLVRHMVEDANSPAPSAAIFEPDTALRELIAPFREQHTEFDSLIVADTKGHILAAVPPINPARAVVADRSKWDWFTKAFNNQVGATYVSGPVDDGLTGLRGIHLAVPVYDQSSPGTVIAVIYGIWNMSTASALTTPGGDRQAAIIDSSGRVLLSPTQARGDSLDPGLLAQLKQSMEQRAFAYTDSQGKRALYGHTSFSDLGLGDATLSRLDWIVIVIEPTSVVDSNAALLTGRLRLLLGTASVMATLVVLFFSRVMFSPLRRLTLAATQIERGSLDTAIPQFSKDEIGQLSSILNSLVGQLLRRVRHLRSAVQISRVAAVTQSTEQILEDVARALGQQLEYPDVRIFLTDQTGQRLRMEAAFGAESERLFKIGFRLPLDETSLVGRAMLLSEPLLGGGKEALREAGLITEHSEMAVPLSAAGQILGAIHILAGRLRELDKEDVEVVSLIADHVSAAVQNTRLLDRGRAQVAEIEALNRRLTRQAWEEYVGESGSLRHTLDPDKQWPETPDDVREMTEIKAEAYVDANGRSVLAAPLILRGEPVGSLAITRPAGEKWSRDEILLLESIASRMTLIAEGIRLVEESSRKAEREQRVNEVSASLLQRATSVETVLRSALNELGGALGSDRIALRIGSAPVRVDHQIGTGSLPDHDSQAENAPDGSGGANGDGETNNGI